MSAFAKHRCTFCGAHSDDVGKLFAGPNRQAICDRCVTVCVAHLNGEPAYDDIPGRLAKWRRETPVVFRVPADMRILSPDYLTFQPAYAVVGTDGGLWRRVLAANWLARLGGDPVECGTGDGKDFEGVVHFTGGCGAQDFRLEVAENLTGMGQHAAGVCLFPQQQGDKDFQRHQPAGQLHVQFVQRVARCIALVRHALLSLFNRWRHYGEGRGE